MGGCLASGYNIQCLDSGLSDTIFRTQSSRQYSAQAGGTFHGKELMDDWPPQDAINQQFFHSLVPGSGQRQQEGHTVDLPSESMGRGEKQ